MYYEITACLVSDNRLFNRPSGNSTKGVPHVSHIRSRCHCFYHLERKVNSAYLVITRGECRIPSTWYQTSVTARHAPNIDALYVIEE